MYIPSWYSHYQVPFLLARLAIFCGLWTKVSFDDIYFQLFILYVAREVEFLILILCEVTSWLKGIAVSLWNDRTYGTVDSLLLTIFSQYCIWKFLYRINGLARSAGRRSPWLRGRHGAVQQEECSPLVVQLEPARGASAWYDVRAVASPSPFLAREEEKKIFISLLLDYGSQ